MTTEPFRIPPDDGIPANRLVAAWGWVAAFAVIAGAASGWSICEFGAFGAIVLWLLGVVGGWTARKITQRGVRAIGVALVVSLCAALVFAELCWIRFNTQNGEDGWVASIQLLPTLVTENTMSVGMAALFTVFGCTSAFQQSARDFQWVQIPIAPRK